MTTRHLLAQLSAACTQATGHAVSFTAMGGIQAAARVQAGAAFDLLVLAADALERLAQAGHVDAASVRPWLLSPMAVAIPAQAAQRPDVSSAPTLRQALLAAPRIGYSTGPSGTALLRLLEDWQLMQTLRARLVQAPAGVPVAQLLADGKVDVGFQQLAELQDHAGVTVLGRLPAGCEIITTFAIAISSRSRHPEAARACLDFLCSQHTDAVKRGCALEPAHPLWREHQP